MGKKAKTDVRQEITCLEARQIHVSSPQQSAQALTIPCKNSLPDVSRARRSHARQATQGQENAPSFSEANNGGLQRNLSRLSTEDAEAARAILDDAASGNNGSDSGRPAHAPILMRNATKRAREGSVQDPTRDKFETTPIESFGEALMRGMGYDPKVHNTKPVIRETLRDSLLGLGAKPLLPSEKMMLANRKKGAATSKDASKNAPGAEVKQTAEAQSSTAAAPSSAVK